MGSHLNNWQDALAEKAEWHRWRNHGLALLSGIAVSILILAEILKRFFGGQ